jgi:hypothetical protein
MLTIILISRVRHAVPRRIRARVRSKHPQPVAIRVRRSAAQVVGVERPVVEGGVGKVHFEGGDGGGVRGFVGAAAAYAADAEFVARDVVELGPAGVVFLVGSSASCEREG